MSTKTRILSVTILTATLLAANSALANGNLLVNGGFENTGFGGTGSYYNVGLVGDHPVPSDFGWSVPVNNVDIVANGQYSPAHIGGGAYVLDLVGYGSTGAISQSINTVAGATYNFSVAYAENNGINNAAADILVNGAPVLSLAGAHQWQVATGSFIGTGSPVTFGLSETVGGGNAGVFLDSISVSANVPEPTAWVTMLLGLCGVGVALRSRRQAAVAG